MHKLRPAPGEHEKDTAKAFDFPADAEPIARRASENVAELPFQVSQSGPETLRSQFPEPGASGWVPEGWYTDTAAGIVGTAGTSCA